MSRCHSSFGDAERFVGDLEPAEFGFVPEPEPGLVLLPPPPPPPAAAVGPAGAEHTDAVHLLQQLALSYQQQRSWQTVLDYSVYSVSNSLPCPSLCLVGCPGELIVSGSLLLGVGRDKFDAVGG